MLLTTRQIQQQVGKLGRHISRDYEGRQPVLVGVQRGMVCFMADLMRKISLPIGIDFMTISPYAGGRPKAVRITKDLDMDISEQDVILVEDIVDTGMTLNYLMAHLKTKGPASLEVCALLDKRGLPCLRGRVGAGTTKTPQGTLPICPPPSAPPPANRPRPRRPQTFNSIPWGL